MAACGADVLDVAFLCAFIDRLLAACLYMGLVSVTCSVCGNKLNERLYLVLGVPELVFQKQTLVSLPLPNRF